MSLCLRLNTITTEIYAVVDIWLIAIADGWLTVESTVITRWLHETN